MGLQLEMGPLQQRHELGLTTQAQLRDCQGGDFADQAAQAHHAQARDAQAQAAQKQAADAPEDEHHVSVSA